VSADLKTARVAALIAAVTDLRETPLHIVLRIATQAHRVPPPPPRPDGLHHPRRDLTGQRYGTLTVTGWLGRSRWECRCDCGGVCTALTANLSTFTVKRCSACRSKGASDRVRALGPSLAARYLAGESPASIAVEVRVSGKTVQRVLREMGVTLRPLGRPRRRA